MLRDVALWLHFTCTKWDFRRNLLVQSGLGLIRPNNTHREEPFNYSRAKEQHEKYLDALYKAGVTEIHQLAADEKQPDCVFVEDTAVVIGDTVMLTNPMPLSRRPEVQTMARHFGQYPDKHIVEMNSKGTAFCDGGDVLFTGSEIFVGFTKRTNMEAIDFISKTFPQYPVHSIDAQNDALHLKCFVSMFGENLMAFGSSQTARTAKDEILRKAQESYKTVDLEHDEAANAVLVNSTLIYQQKYESDIKKIEQNLAVNAVPVDLSELMKIDGLLTCCSVLYN